MPTVATILSIDALSAKAGGAFVTGGTGGGATFLGAKLNEKDPSTALPAASAPDTVNVMSLRSISAARLSLEIGVIVTVYAVPEPATATVYFASSLDGAPVTPTPLTGSLKVSVTTVMPEMGSVGASCSKVGATVSAGAVRAANETRTVVFAARALPAVSIADTVSVTHPAGRSLSPTANAEGVTVTVYLFIVVGSPSSATADTV